MPLLLIHGTGGSASRWAGITPALEQHFTVHAMDRRGRGSSSDGHRYSLECEVGDVVAVIDSTDGPPLVLGHSFGGLVALEAAAERPNIRGLILYEPPIRAGGRLFRAGTVARLQHALAHHGPEAVVEIFMRSVAGVTPAQLLLMKQAPSWPARVAAAHTFARELRASEEHEFTVERFQNLMVPVLLLRGGESVGFAESATERLQGTLPRATTVVLDGQAHTAMDTDPMTFVTLVKSYAEQLADDLAA